MSGLCEGNVRPSVSEDKLLQLIIVLIQLCQFHAPIVRISLSTIQIKICSHNLDVTGLANGLKQF